MHTDAIESTESTGTRVAWKAFKEAFPVTLPILAGFWFVAFAYAAAEIKMLRENSGAFERASRAI